MALDLNNPPPAEDGPPGPHANLDLNIAVEGAAAEGEGGPAFGAVHGAGGVHGADGGPVLGAVGGAAGVPVFDLNMEPELDLLHEEHVGLGAEGNAEANEAQGENVFLNNTQRDVVYRALLETSNNGKLRKNSTKIVSASLGVNLRTVQRIWHDAQMQKAQGLDVDVSHKKTCRVGRKKIQIDFSKVPSIALRKRTTLRSLASELHVSVSTLHRRFKLGALRRHSNTLKPCLKDENKKSRLRFCLSMLEQSTINTDPKFSDMHNIIHIDEKWWYMTKKSKKYYLLPEEEDPHRTVTNKNSIGKMMFLGVVGKPKHDTHGNETFSGKIGMFAFVKEEPAARSSRNRPRGTLIKKSVIVNREVMKDYLINKVLPAIAEVWPEEQAGETIYIQQDNARTHVSPSDPEFLAAVQQTGLDIRLMQQPSNSPDMNILDLGFFSSIQSLTDKRSPTTIEELIRDVEEEFSEYDSSKLTRVFLTLQACLIETMKCNGNNKYKQPHMNKDGLERVGALPSRLSCDLSLVQRVREIVGHGS